MCSVRESVASFLKDYGLENKILCVGFSGGYDSMCLLHILHSFGCNIVAAHLNHNWRGGESMRDEENCRKFCDARGITFYSEILPPDTPHTETAARTARYEFFERVMRKFNSDCILTAHNADDNAETLLYRIIKGTGIDGLVSIAPKRDSFYRPLLKVRRSEIEDYCRENNLTPNIDSSNDDVSYNRNFLRHNVMPLLKMVNPDAIGALNSLSSLAGELCSALNTEKNYTTEEFLNLPVYFQGEIIKRLLVNRKIEYDREKIEALKDFVGKNRFSKSGAKCSLGKNIWFFVNCDYFDIVKTVEKISDEICISQEGEYSFGDYIFSIEKCQVLPEAFPPDSEYCAYVNLEKFNYTLRTRREGDIIFPLGASGVQKLKKYLNEKKIPFYKKDSIPLLCEGKEILWAAGVGMSDKIKVAGNVSHVLKLIKKAG